MWIIFTKFIAGIGFIDDFSFTSGFTLANVLLHRGFTRGKPDGIKLLFGVALAGPSRAAAAAFFTVVRDVGLAVLAVFEPTIRRIVRLCLTVFQVGADMAIFFGHSKRLVAIALVLLAFAVAASVRALLFFCCAPNRRRLYRPCPSSSLVPSERSAGDCSGRTGFAGRGAGSI